MVLNNNEVETDRLMREGQAAAKRGDKAMARVLLTQLLEVQPDNEQAWMWLSGVVTDPNEQTTCLENVLILNPNNPQARKGLDFIRTKTIGTKDLAGTGGAAQANGASEEPVPFDPTSVENGYRAPASAGFETGPIEATLPASWDSAPTGDAPVAPMTLTPSDGAADVLPDFLQMTPGTPQSPSAQAPAAQQAHEQLPAESAPTFQVPDDANMPMYTGGPPTPGLPPDMGAAMPEWVRDASAVRNAEPLSGRQSDAAQHHADTMAANATEASTGPNPDTDLNAWLEELTTSANFNFEEEGKADETASQSGMSGEAPTGSTPIMDPFGQGMPFPADPFANPGPLDFGPVGPYSATNLPSPEDLPGDHGADGQPWYLQSSHPSGHIGSPPEFGPEDTSHIGQGGDGQGAVATAQVVATMECPYCFHQVPDTSLACPECRYAFFAHCPHCHELVDTSGAKEGVVEPCPYCAVELNKWDLGLNAARGLVLPHAVPKESALAWVGQPLVAPKGRRVFNFGWLVDVMWLIIVVLMIWALTQLPLWLHLTDLYN